MSSSPVAGSLAIGSRLMEYEIVRVLGHGGFGITYLARDTHLDKSFAIKEYLPADLAVRTDASTVTVRADDTREAFDWGREQFMKEARVLARFSHANLIEVHRFFEAHGTAYFVMEYAEGTTLDVLLRQQSTLPEARIRELLLPILHGLEEVHRAGVLHRDIKPGNIIVRSDGSPVLIDFGAARQNLTSATRSVMSVLTAGYAPIEQYSSSTGQGPWTDLYALGAVAYRMISGKKPVDAVARVRDDPLVPATTLGQGRYSPHFLAAVDWAMAVDLDERPKSIGEWRRALDGQLTVPAVSPPPPAPARKPVSEEKTQISPRSESTANATEILVRPPPTPLEAQEHTQPVLTALPLRKNWLPIGGGIAAAVVVLGLVAFFGLRSKPAPPAAEPAPAAAPVLVAPPVEPPVIAQTPSPTPEPMPVATTEATLDAPIESVPAVGAATAPSPAETPASETTTAAAPAKAPVEAPAKKPKQKKAPKKAPDNSKALKAVADMSALSGFRDCPQCPPMVVLPAGRYLMGAAAGAGSNPWEQPQHPVTFRKAFAIGKFEVTAAEWRSCVAAKACSATTLGENMPAVTLHWADAQDYTQWLSKQAGRRYRLPTEAEWEYAARAGSNSARYWGEDRSQQCLHANGADISAAKVLGQGSRLVDCDDGYPLRAPVGSFRANAFGLFDMAGNAWEWTMDCWHDGYAGAPADGSAWDSGNCEKRVIRGGSWRTKPESMRSANRGVGLLQQRSDDLGLRVVAE